MLQRVKKSNCRSEIELHMSTILKFKYYGTSCNVKKFQTGDILRDCRKSQKMAILAFSHVIKSICYKHQIHRFRVFRQSLRVSKHYLKCRNHYW